MKTRIKGLLACLAAGTLVGCVSGGGSGGSGHGQVAPPPAPSQSSRSGAQSDSESLRNDQRPAGPMRPHAACRDRCGVAQSTGARCPMPKPSRRSACIHRPGAAPPGRSSVSAPAAPPHGYVRMDMCHEPNTVGTIQRARSASGAMERGSRRVDRMARGAAGGGGSESAQPVHQAAGRHKCPFGGFRLRLALPVVRRVERPRRQLPRLPDGLVPRADDAWACRAEDRQRDFHRQADRLRRPDRQAPRPAPMWP